MKFWNRGPEMPTEKSQTQLIAELADLQKQKKDIQDYMAAGEGTREDGKAIDRLNEQIQEIESKIESLGKAA